MKISEIMSTLNSLGAAPRKSLGQNFLHDQNIARWIVSQLDLQPGEHVLEIGPGLGALSAPVANLGMSATLLEKDRLFAEYLRSRLPTGQVEVISGDALTYDVRQLFPRRPVKLLGALPYYVSTPLIFHFMAEPCPFDRIVLTLQREVADRLAAQPATKAFGSLSLVVQSRWEVRKLKVLSRSVFIPEPRVDSAVILLTPRRPGTFPDFDYAFFVSLLRTGFSQRRKQVANLLTELSDADALASALAQIGAPPNTRAESLSLRQWIDLTNLLRPKPILAEESEEELDVVDEHDVVTGSAPRGIVHAKNLLHRAVHIFVWNDRGELLLQKRSAQKEQYPGCWDSSAAGHLESGEDYRHCAARELREELGLGAELTAGAKIPASVETGFEFISVFQTCANGPITYNPAEIQQAGFFPRTLVDEWIERRPADFAPGFLEAYRQVVKNLFAGSSVRLT
jgi:16S rRNA (adenine1518-N6/adenine1519-N6)-dimethyltransferase